MMKNTTTIIDKIYVLLDPRFWIRPRVDHKWSDRLDYLMDEGHQVKSSTNKALRRCYSIGPVLFFADYSIGEIGIPAEPHIICVPRRKTALRLYKLIKQFHESERDLQIEKAIIGRVRF